MSQSSVDYILVGFMSACFLPADVVSGLIKSLSVQQDVKAGLPTMVMSVSWHFKFHLGASVCVC